MGKKSFQKLRVEFLPEALEIVEKPTAPLGNIIIWLVFILLLLFVLWASFGKIDEVATARGQIMSDDGIQELQAAGSGVVTEVKIKEGDVVQKGDILYIMDKEVEQNNIEYSEGEIGLLELRMELLTHLINGKDIRDYRTRNYNEEQMEIVEYMISLDESDELSVKEYEIAVENAKNQYDLAQENLGNSETKGEYLEEQKELKDQSNFLQSSLEIELELLENNYEVACEAEETYHQLYSVGAKSYAEWQAKVHEKKNLEMQIEMQKIAIENEKLSKESDVSTMDYQIAENETQYTNQQGTIENAKSNYDSALLNLENAKTQRNSKLHDMKEQYNNQLKQYGVTVEEQYYQYESKDIVALYDGVVKTLHVDKAGSVVTATQVVAEILPDSSQLIIEAEVSNVDIGYVEVGQEVDIKIDTYDYQKYGKLTGTVMYISPDAIENEQMEQVYKANILIEDGYNEKIDISQGMECSVEIKTGKKRIIAFFLEPLVEALESSLKER